MSGSAVCLGVLGVGLLFLPGELAPVFGLPAGADVLIQLTSAGLLSMAILNWTGRGAIYGGVFGRPIILANFAFGMIGGGSLLSDNIRGGGEPAAWALTVFLLVYAGSFARLMFVPPKRPETG